MLRSPVLPPRESYPIIDAIMSFFSQSNEPLIADVARLMSLAIECIYICKRYVIVSSHTHSFMQAPSHILIHR